MKKYMMFAIAGLMASTAQAQISLSTLRCADLRKQYEVKVIDNSVRLTLTSISGMNAYVIGAYTFKIRDCIFSTKDLLSLKCADEKAKLTVKKSVVSTFNNVKFQVSGNVGSLESLDFLMEPIEMGQRARCYINGLYELSRYPNRSDF